MFDKMRKGAFLLTLAGLAVATLTGSTAAAASSQPAMSAAVENRGAAPVAWDIWDAPQAVLYNQLNNCGANAVSSQNFETAYDAYDDFGADDFVVPPNTSWTINRIGLNGLYYGCTPPACGPANTFNVFFHQDNGGLPKDPPAATRLNSNAVETPAGSGFFVITLSSPLTIPASPSPRHVWVSAQANLDFGTGGQFGWTVRTVQSNSPAAWKNPGGGFGVCPNWSPMAGCIGITDPDFCFGVAGTHTP